MNLSHKQLQYLGWIATVASLAMYVSYIPQIMDNLSGNITNPTQPLAAALNCTLWVSYGLLRPKKDRDWPLAMANMPGIIFGLLAFLTAI